MVLIAEDDDKNGWWQWGRRRLRLKYQQNRKKMINVVVNILEMSLAYKINMYLYTLYLKENIITIQKYYIVSINI